jgi:hypothetical protein
VEGRIQEAKQKEGWVVFFRGGSVLFFLLLFGPLLGGPSFAGPGGTLQRLATMAAELPPPPPLGEMGTLSAEALRELANSRTDFLSALREDLPVSARGLSGRTRPRGKISFEDLSGLALQIRFSGLLELRRGRRLQGVRLQLRLLRLGVFLGDSPLGLSLQALTLKDLARAMLTGSPSRKFLEKVERVLVAFSQPRPDSVKSAQDPLWSQVLGARELALMALDVARQRARVGHWPRYQESLAAAPRRDLLGGGELHYALVEGFPVLASGGRNGRWEEFRIPRDEVVGADPLMWKIERVRDYALEFDVRTLGRVFLPPGERARPLPPASRQADCGQIRRRISLAQLDFEREVGIELEERPEETLALLQRERYYLGPNRCPTWGLFSMAGGRWVCTRHPSSYDPRPSYPQQLLTRVVCQRRRLAQVPALEQFAGEVDVSPLSLGASYQEELRQRGYLQEISGCPSAGGSWSLTKQGLVCSQHLPAVRVKLPDF